MATFVLGRPPAHMRLLDTKVRKESACLKVHGREPLKSPKELRVFDLVCSFEKRSAASFLVDAFGSLELTRLVEEYTSQRRSFATQSYDCQGCRRSSVCEMKISLETPGRLRRERLRVAHTGEPWTSLLLGAHEHLGRARAKAVLANGASAGRHP